MRDGRHASCGTASPPLPRDPRDRDRAQGQVEAGNRAILSRAGKAVSGLACQCLPRLSPAGPPGPTFASLSFRAQHRTQSLSPPGPPSGCLRELDQAPRATHGQRTLSHGQRTLAPARRSSTGRQAAARRRKSRISNTPGTGRQAGQAGCGKLQGRMVLGAHRADCFDSRAPLIIRVQTGPRP